MNDALDAVLERFATTGPEFGRGLANHGPMASEALIALGRGDVVEAWAEEYATQLGEHPEERNPIAAGTWREGLGDIRRAGDWTAFFQREIGEQPWAELVETWVARLGPGIMAGATHGIIRTAHAVRALEQGETPPRLHELAEGLGYWAARYQELPVRSGGVTLASVEQALARIPRIDDSRRGRFLIFDAVRVLEEESFGPAIDYVATDGDADAFVSALTRAFVRQYLANANTAAIGFVHTVTAPAALRILAPHLSDGTRRAAMRYAWQACAAIYATYSRVKPMDAPSLDAEIGFDEEDLIDQAVAARDEHAIKFTEACLREHRISGDPAFIVAVRDAVNRMRR